MKSPITAVLGRTRGPASARAGTLAAILCLAFGAATAHAGVVAPVLVGQSVAHAVFAEPLPENSDQAIHNHLLSLINNTPEWKGARIRAGIHSISSTQIKDALLYKAARGVDVKIVHSGHVGRSGVPQDLANGLGSGRFNWCDHGANGASGWGCISTAPGGTMHSKFFLFSATDVGGLRKWVTWFGSANLTQSSGTETWNNGLTIYDNYNLFRSFETKIFDNMWSEFSPVYNDFYRPDVGQGYFSEPSAAIKVHASPEQDSDLVVSRLNEMRADAACTVLVGMMQFTRTMVADKLAAMKRSGCTVFVLVGMEDGAKTAVSGVTQDCAGNPHMGDPVKATLKAAGIPIRKKKIHDKIMLLNASNKLWITLTGSHNLSSAAVRENDELLVEIASQPAYDAYSEHWWSAWMNSCAV